MDRLLMEGSKSTPRVDLNENKLSITGQSYPENAVQFYVPIFDWLNTYLNHLESNAEILFEFNLLYMNTSSSKCIMDIIDMLELAYQNDKKIVVNWFYDIDNESLLECAEELKEDISFPFHVITLES